MILCGDIIRVLNVWQNHSWKLLAKNRFTTIFYRFVRERDYNFIFRTEDHWNAHVQTLLFYSWNLSQMQEAVKSCQTWKPRTVWHQLRNWKRHFTSIFTIDLWWRSGKSIHHLVNAFLHFVHTRKVIKLYRI